MNLDLSNKNALVSGSTQGIGFASAMELAAMGANVVLLARNEARLKTAMERLPNNGKQSHSFVVADFAHLDSVKQGVDQALEIHNEFHILVNNTGGPPGGPISEAGIEEFDSAFNNHLKANHLITTALIPGMKRAGYGRIVNVISTSVKAPLSGLGVSNTIRGAVANWSKTLANELGQFNITVNNVLPGATHTARLQSIAENKAAKTGQSADEVLEVMANQVPMKRVAQPEEVANAIAFLASPAASYINGINVPVDGGRTPCL